MSDPKVTGFELIEKLGQGGMGVVWKARQLSLDRIVAIKVLAPSLSQNPENIRAIMNEARLAARLKHPGIVQVYDAGEEEGSCYFVMEYVDGYSVGLWLQRRRLIAPKDALLVAEHVAVALDYAWQTAGLIHCDIKPENIMVENDGAIKVADLGLSRTVGMRNPADDEIAGTPSFMSPEQAGGANDLDCRTDVYSLGATLYNMLTGHRLFQDFANHEAIAQQISGSVGDPRDIVPNLSTGTCRLLERLLVKDRALRPADWITVLNDIRRVQKGLPPVSKPPPAGASTLRLNSPSDGKATIGPQRPKRPLWKPLTAWLLGLVLLAFGAWVAWRVWTNRGAGGAENPAGGQILNRALSEIVSPSNKGDGRAAAAYKEVQDWMQDYPERLEEAMGRLNEIVSRYPGSPESEQALSAIRRLRGKAEEAGKAAWQKLRADAETLSREGRTVEAIGALESYAGIGAEQSASNRLELARQLRRLLAGEQVAQLQSAKWKTFLAGLADLILRGRPDEAAEAVSKAAGEPGFESHRDELAALGPLFKGGGKADERVIGSFLGNTGRVVNIKVGQATIPVKVLGIVGQKVHGMAVDEQSEVFIGAKEMAPSEKLARLGDADSPDLAMTKGVLCVQARSFDRAAECFANVGPILSPVLVQRLEALTKPAVDDPAETALGRVLAVGGIRVGPYEEAAWIEAVKTARLDTAVAVATGLERERFLEKFGKSDFAAKATPVLLELERVCEEAKEKGAPGVEKAGDAETAVPTPEGGAVSPAREMTPESVAMSFLSSNPDLAPNEVSLSNAPGGLMELRIASSKVRDLSPLARLPAVGALVLESKAATPVPVDLSPLRGTGIVSVRLEGYVVRDLVGLRGVKLRVLDVSGSPVASLAPLEGMPLVELDLGKTNVRDLGPLHGMKLEILRLDDTKVSSLTPLAGMLLKVLSVRNTGVRDLSCLRGMTLDTLDLSGVPALDFEYLRGCAVRELVLRGTQVRDLSFCGKMPLVALDIGETPIQDLRPLKGRPLERLVLRKSSIRDLEPLKGANIKTLDVSGMRIPIRDLTDFLKSVNVETLDLSNTEVASLSFMEGRKMRSLCIANTRVRDLTPLLTIPLESLDCRGCPIEDYSLLRTLPLTSLWCDAKLDKYRQFFLAMPKLMTVNGVDVRPKSGAK